MRYALFLPFFILLLSVNLIIFDPTFYEKEIENYALYEEQVDNLLDFFKGGTLDEKNYSEREILHLGDVRNLIWMSLALLIFLSILCISSLRKKTKEQMKKECILGGLYTLLGIVLLSLTLLGFSYVFTIFHQIFFTNDLWLLPANSLLIQMFPERFFIESTKQILLYSLIFSLLSIALGIFPRRKKYGRRA